MAIHFYKAVGARIRLAREGADLNQDDLAKAAGINRSYLSRSERGLQNLSLLTIGRIAAALNVCPSVFFEGIVVDATTLVGPARGGSAGGAPEPDAPE